ncbi:MAG: hypothetical protein MZV49_13860 [Rhodopseudomonas palustris]|nr:hypothetical protein [Rhodopseudomonas palustris]
MIAAVADGRRASAPCRRQPHRLAKLPERTARRDAERCRRNSCCKSRHRALSLSPPTT